MCTLFDQNLVVLPTSRASAVGESAQRDRHLSLVAPNFFLWTFSGNDQICTNSQSISELSSGNWSKRPEFRTDLLNLAVVTRSPEFVLGERVFYTLISDGCIPGDGGFVVQETQALLSSHACCGRHSLSPKFLLFSKGNYLVTFLRKLEHCFPRDWLFTLVLLTSRSSDP